MLPDKLWIESWVVADLPGEGLTVLGRLATGLFIDPTQPVTQRLSRSEIEIIETFWSREEAEASLARRPAFVKRRSHSHAR